VRRRGLTLTEVLLAGSLSLLLLGLLIQTVEISRRGWRQSTNLQSAQSSTLVAATRLREDFRKSRCLGNLTIASAPDSPNVEVLKGTTARKLLHLCHHGIAYRFGFTQPLHIRADSGFGGEAGLEVGAQRLGPGRKSVEFLANSQTGIDRGGENLTCPVGLSDHRIAASLLKMD